LSKKKLIAYAIVTFCLVLMVFSNAAQNATARETLSVTIVPPAKTTVPLGDVVQLEAQASGGPGEYNIQWYSNDTAIEYATWTPYPFNATQIGSYTIKCIVTDATGTITGSATSSPLYLTVTARSIAASSTPKTSDLPRVGNTADNGTVGATGINDQGVLLAAVIAVVVVFAVVVAFLVMKYRGSKKTNNS
jgi:hypothetical protein